MLNFRITDEPEVENVFARQQWQQLMLPDGCWPTPKERRIADADILNSDKYQQSIAYRML